LPATIVGMTGETAGNVATWAGGAFHADVVRWVEKAAADTGVTLTGEREQPHNRPWSSAIRFGAEGGDLWFKVNGPGTRHEGVLVTVLADLEPDLVPPVLAADRDRGWSLTRDAGPVMRSVAPPEQLWDSWAEVLVRYADAQVRLAGHAERVLSAGLREVSPTTLPRQLRALVDELGSQPPEQGGLTEREQARLLASLDEYDAWCAELAASGIPSSVQHDDVHSSNICWGGSAATARIIDWGDTIWGFPIGTMLGTVNSIAWHAKCERTDPRVLRVRDAYLEPFTTYASRDELVRWVDLARRTGCVTKALSYRASLLGEPLSTHQEEDFPVRGWLLEIFEI
jgi:hypothetical protein